MSELKLNELLLLSEKARCSRLRFDTHGVNHGLQDYLRAGRRRGSAEVPAVAMAPRRNAPVGRPSNSQLLNNQQVPENYAFLGFTFVFTSFLK